MRPQHSALLIHHSYQSLSPCPTYFFLYIASVALENKLLPFQMEGGNRAVLSAVLAVTNMADVVNLCTAIC
jgi:hypothetical protein